MPSLPDHGECFKRVGRLIANPGKRRPEDAAATFWRIVDASWFGSEFSGLDEVDRLRLLTAAQDCAWRMQFGGVAKHTAFMDALAARSFDLPDTWDEWLTVLTAAPHCVLRGV